MQMACRWVKKAWKIEEIWIIPQFIGFNIYLPTYMGILI